MKKGLEEQAKKMGIIFAGGKFDLNKSSALPLSAFSTAMSSLTKHIMETKHVDAIKSMIEVSFVEEDMIRLINIMPGCQELFTFEGSSNCLPMSASSVRSISSTIGDSGKKEYYRRLSSFVGGKEDVKRLQYSIRVLLKAICTHLQGVVIFLDDLQWSDVTTIELMKSIMMDKEIPSLLLTGAYREDEVSE